MALFARAHANLLRWTVDKPYQRPRDVITSSHDLNVDRREISKCHRHLEASPRLTHRPESRVIAQRTVLPARIHPFRQIERNAARRAPQLSTEVSVTPLNLHQNRPKRRNNL